MSVNSHLKGDSHVAVSAEVMQWHLPCPWRCRANVVLCAMSHDAVMLAKWSESRYVCEGGVNAGIHRLLWLQQCNVRGHQPSRNNQVLSERIYVVRRIYHRHHHIGPESMLDTSVRDG